MAAKRRFWLMKSEPEEYSIDDLRRDGSAPWDGVRNYQARNFMRDQMQVGDLVLFYHSNSKPPGVAGLARICREAYPDPTQFEVGHAHQDARSPVDDPRWCMVDVEYVETFPTFVSLDELKADEKLDGMLVRRRGQRLSVQPVEKVHFERIRRLAGSKVRTSA